MTDPVVVLAASPRPWAAALRAHAADHGGVVIRATVLTPEDALAEPCDVVLVDDVTSFLTAPFVAGLQHGGRAVLGLYDPTDDQGKSDLVDAGVDALAPADVVPAELVGQLRRLAARRPEDRPQPRRPAGPPPAGAGRVVGVVGPSGGVGVSEVALELAAAIASAGRAAVLVDVDELAPGHAQRLGLAVHPNLRTAVLAVERGQPVGSCLHPLATRAQLAVLPGLVVADDWAAVPPAAPGRVVAALAAAHGAVVLDLGRAVPPADGPTGLRFGHAQALAGRCDDLVVVCAPTPMAVSRTIDLVARVGGGPARLHLVLNRVGADRYVRDEVVAELRRATGLPAVHLVAEDPKVPRAAWQGQRVGRGRFRSSVGELAGALVAGR